MLEFKEEWLGAVEGLVPLMNVFGIHKKFDSTEATVTPLSQAKLAKMQIGRGVWIPHKLARTLLQKKQNSQRSLGGMKVCSVHALQTRAKRALARVDLAESGGYRRRHRGAH